MRRSRTVQRSLLLYSLLGRFQLIVALLICVLVIIIIKIITIVIAFIIIFIIAVIIVVILLFIILRLLIIIIICITVILAVDVIGIHSFEIAVTAVIVRVPKWVKGVKMSGTGTILLARVESRSDLRENTAQIKLSV